MAYQTYGNNHTADFYVRASNTTIERIIKKNAHIITHQNKYICKIFMESITITLDPRTSYIQIYVDLIKLIGNPMVTPEDAETVRDTLNNTLYKLSPFLSEPILKRIDMRYDVVLKEEIRQIYFDLIEKSSNWQGSLKRYKPELCKGESLYYMSQVIKENVRINIYDKTAERINRSEQILVHEKDVVRFEVQLFGAHLNNMKSRFRINKDLDYYMSEECLNKYLETYIVPILFRGTYRSLDSALEIIKKSSMKNLYKNKLTKLLDLINSKNVDIAKTQYSGNTWKKYIRLLEELDINPITLPEEYQLRKLVNPLS